MKLSDCALGAFVCKPSSQKGKHKQKQKRCVCSIFRCIKQGMPFPKPVDALVGEAILAWEKVHPEQPQMIDGKTGEVAHFLFCYRAHRLRKEYLNLCLIPALCQRAAIWQSY